MVMFNTDIRVATTATPSPTSDTNVGGFGWTQSDLGHYNQLIKYVNECRKIFEEIERKTEIFDIVKEESDNIQRAINYVYETSKEIREMGSNMEISYNRNQLLLEQMRLTVSGFNSTYADFEVKYADFLKKYQEIINKFP